MSNVEDLNLLNLRFTKDIIEIARLEREREPISSKVEIDEATKMASENLNLFELMGCEDELLNVEEIKKPETKNDDLFSKG